MNKHDELKIENLCKTYQDNTVALEDFNWELGPGIYGLLGPNGAGKSTLLEMLSLNLMPTSGKIYWNEKNVQKHPGRFRKALGYLPQEYGFYPELKAHQFLNYMGRLHGMSKKDLKNRIDESLELVNMEDRKKKKIKSFSGGMKQRLAIAQALIHRPRLLVIDEPTTGLDPSERVSFRNLLFELGRRCVVLLSTHIVKDVEFTCHYMTVLYGGRQRFTGKPVDFIRRMEGRVYEKAISPPEIETFSKTHHVIAIKETPEHVIIRFILAGKGETPPVNATPVKANLEDTYVEFIRKQESSDIREEEIG